MKSKFALMMAIIMCLVSVAGCTKTDSGKDVSSVPSEIDSSDSVPSEENITSVPDITSFDNEGPSSSHVSNTASGVSNPTNESDKSNDNVSDIASNNQSTVSEVEGYPNVTVGADGRFTTTLDRKYPATSSIYRIKDEKLFIIYTSDYGRWITVVDLTNGKIIKDVKFSIPKTKKGIYGAFINDEALWLAFLKTEEKAFAWRYIVKFDLDTLEIIGTISIPDHPFKEFEVYGDYIYFCELEKDSVWRYNMKDGTYLNIVETLFKPFPNCDYTFYTPTIAINDQNGDLLICDGNNNFALIDTNKMTVKSTAFSTTSPSDSSEVGNIIYHNGYFYVNSKKIDANHVGNIVCTYGTGSRSFHFANDKYVITSEGFFRNSDGKLIHNLQSFPKWQKAFITDQNRFVLVFFQSRKGAVYNYPLSQVLPYGTAY